MIESSDESETERERIKEIFSLDSLSWTKRFLTILRNNKYIAHLYQVK